MSFKKQTKETITEEITKLQSMEQTPEIMEKIYKLTLKLETFKDAPEKKASEKKAGKTGFMTFEEWELEKVTLKKVKTRKECRMLQEHADILNEQSANTLLQYIEKEA